MHTIIIYTGFYLTEISFFMSWGEEVSFNKNRGLMGT